MQGRSTGPEYIVWQPEDDIFAVVERGLFKAEAPRSIVAIVDPSLLVASFDNAEDAEEEAARLNRKGEQPWKQA